VWLKRNIFVTLKNEFVGVFLKKRENYEGDDEYNQIKRKRGGIQISI
jgi:hypothetical protein